MTLMSASSPSADAARRCCMEAQADRRGRGARETETEEEEVEETEEAKPPWGSDGEFDPEKAWKLIQNVRSDADKAKKDADELRLKVKDAEDAEKSEQEKLQERATEAETRATTAESTALRIEVALDKAPEGMPIAQIRKLAKRLAGSTREELEADAEELFADFTPEGEEGQAPRRPRERLRPGAAPSSEPEETDPRKLAEKVSRRF
jgi:ribosomal protein L22